jgi:hypothetical protein
MKIKELRKNKFDGGKVFDKRQFTPSGFAKSLNFDIHDNPSVLTPVRSYEADESYGAGSITSSTITNFGQIGASTIYAVGHKADGTGRKLYSKSIADSAWTAVLAGNGSVAETTGGCPVPGFYIEQFNSSGLALHWFVTGNATTPSASTWILGLNSYATPTVAVDFAKKALSLNPTFYPQGILGIDGNVYVSDNYKIHKAANTGTVTDSIFTVSQNFAITSLALYGNYLAIAIYGQGKSKVLLWDYASAQASETIDWGEGALIVLENIEGQLVGITDKYINSTLFSSATGGNGSMQVKVWGGGSPTSVNEVRALGVTSGAIKQFKYVKSGMLYWYAKIPLDNTGTEFEEGLWTFGRRISSQPFSLVLEREIAGTSFEGFWGIGNYLYLPNSGDGSVDRTSSSATYGLTSIYETEIINDDNSNIEKNALGFSLSFEPLAANQTLAVKYRTDGDTDWTAITPSPSVQVGDVSSLYSLEFNFHEIEFRIESVGGAKPTGYRFRYESLASNLE